MTLSCLPLSYCTNAHPGASVEQILAGLDRYTLPVRERLGKPLAAGLWLAAPVIRDIFATPDGLQRFTDALHSRGLTCHTLNAFPFGDFHSPRVKENVYRPDWSEPQRLEYTMACARVLAALLPEGVDGSISSVPLAFKPFGHSGEFIHRCIDQLLALASELDTLKRDTGRTIRLAIEPEPFCLLETTDETLAFFDQLRYRAGAARLDEVVDRHIGVCFDVCHQSVEFEDVADSIRRIDAAGIRINKVHISCALQLDNPADASARRALAEYVEPRYLHQTTARSAAGEVIRAVDLTPELALTPPPDFAAASAWRIHFHVPVDAESLGPLATTRRDLRRALTAVKALDYAPHLEVETYTWEVLPGRPADLVQGLTRELLATADLLRSIGDAPAGS